MAKNKLVAPVVKWVGGKRQLLDEITPLLPKRIASYCEPFLGGGAVLFSIQPSKAIVNDLNGDLVAVYNLYRLKYLFSYDKIIFASFWRICLNFRLTGHNRQNKIDISEYIIMGSDYMPVPFDSRKIYYRSPFGAVEQGTEIHFRILLPKAEHTQKAHLCVKYVYLNCD